MGKKKNDDEGLPYFKFRVSKWITGDITECTLSAQGLFINLCAQYWSKAGVVSLEKMKKKFPRKQKHFEELVDAGILKLDGDHLVISFLDEQLEERGLVSEKNRNIAKEAWNKRKSDANASETHSERNANAMPIEEKREEEKREEESEIRAHVEFVPGNGKTAGGYPFGTSTSKNEIFEEIFSDERFVEGLARSYPSLDYNKAWSDCWNYHSVMPTPPEHGWQWKQKLLTWLDIEKKKNGTSKTTRTEQVNSRRESFAKRYGTDGGG